MKVTVGRKFKGEQKNCLTIREHEAFTLILCGNDNLEIARKMDLSPHSIHKQLVYKGKNDLLVAHLDQAFVQKHIDLMLEQDQIKEER